MSAKSGLERNFPLMFWIQALTEVKVINVISALFLLSRGLSLSQIVLSGVVYSLVTIMFEVPSSYLADKWGRKNLLILSVLTSLVYWTLNVFARGWWLILAVGVYSLANALMSGTDEALIYDTSKELNLESDSLDKLGIYFSGQRIFKIIMPIVAVLVAKNLSDNQYIFLLLIDIVANIGALVLCLRLVEPRHFMEVETVEAGAIKDALKMFKNSPRLLGLVLNKSLMFIAVYMVWRVSSEYFTSMGVSVLMIGLMTAVMQLIIFITNQKVGKVFLNVSEEKKIDWLNWVVFGCMLVFFANNFWGKYIWISLISYVVFNAAQVTEWPLFSQLFNKVSSSYNRATTLSLANFTKSFLDIPLLLFGSFLVGMDYGYLFGLCLLIQMVVVLFFRASRDSGRQG